MSRRVFLPLAILTLIQFSFGVLVASPSLAKEWAVRGKQQGTIKVVDLFLPEISTLQSYAEGLEELDKDNKTVPGLAADWRWINNKTIEFRLREAVRFNNGERFNAEAVKINWEEYRKMENPRPFRHEKLPDETLFEIIDDYTVRFTFPEPDGLALVKLLRFAQFAPAFFSEHKFDEMNWGYLPEPGPWGTATSNLL